MRIDCKRNCYSKMRPFKCSSTIHGRPFTCVVGFFHKCGVKRKLLICIINSFQCKSVKIDMTKNYSIGKLIMLMMYYSEQIIEHEFAVFLAKIDLTIVCQGSKILNNINIILYAHEND